MSARELVTLPSLGSLNEPETVVSDQITVLAEIGRALTAGVAVDESIFRALRALDRRLGARRAVLHGLDPDRAELFAGISHGLPLEHWQGRYSHGVCGCVAESGLPMVVPLVHADSQALSELMDPREWSNPGWSLVCVPLTMSGQVVGTLSAYFRASADPDFSGLLDVLEVVASLLTPALSRLEPRHSSAPSRSAPLAGNGASCNMIGDSPAMRPIYEQIAQVARTNATALIRGPSGTGKELVAQAIHSTSARSRQPFVKVNCAALPETLFESELFGHERGAFTGAFARKKGRFELAQGGTLFLDEVGELSLATQAKLLRVLQFREFERLGSADTLHTDVRMIAATNKDMEQAVAAGTFRKDLYYRLNVFTITLPPLKDRPEDIPALAEHFLARYAQEHRGSTSRLSREALDALVQYPFPGNVRELENVIERAVVVCDGSVILEQHLPDSIRAVNYESARQQLTLAAAVGQLESRMLEEALQNARGNAARAARALGTTERVVRYKALKYGIDCTRFR